jgi:type IV secretory pathway VirB10-like protein
MEIGKGTLGIVAGICLAAGALGTFVATGPGSGAASTSAGTAGAALSPQPDALTTEQAAVETSPRIEPAPTTPAVEPGRRFAGRVAPAAPASSAPAAPPAADATSSDTTAPLPTPPEAAQATQSAIAHVDPAPALQAPVDEPRHEDLTLAADSVIGIQIERTVSSETASVEEEVFGRVTRDVRVGDRVVIPAGTRATGLVTLVERGGRLKERARLGLRFTSVTLADGTRLPLDTEAIFREGESAQRESAAKIGGGAIGGAILGGILGGAKGAAIGGSIGAGAGSAAVLTGGRNAATLPAGSPLTIRLERPATVTVER